MNWTVAQLVERHAVTVDVAGSSPACSATLQNTKAPHIARLMLTKPDYLDTFAERVEIRYFVQTD